MNKFSLALILIFILVFCNSLTVLANTNLTSHHTTLTGEIKLIGTGEMNNVILVENEKKYVIKGELEGELKQLINIGVRVTGLISYSHSFNKDGKIEVIDYSIDNISGIQEHQDWAFGKIYQNEEEFVLIDRNQIIYRVTNFNDLSINDFEENKLLLIGNVKRYNDFFAEIEVSSYKLIKTNY